MSCLITRPHVKFTTDRAVESTAIRRAVESIYNLFLPKGTHPFIYLSIEIDPARVDVNIHPTKREVNMLHEHDVIMCIGAAIQKRLAETDVSRIYATQTLMPGANPLEAGISAEKLRQGKKDAMRNR